MTRQALAITPFYEDTEMPEIETMMCPIADHFACLVDELNRDQLKAHLTKYHPEYNADPDFYFNEERERRLSHNRF